MTQQIKDFLTETLKDLFPNNSFTITYKGLVNYILKPNLLFFQTSDMKMNFIIENSDTPILGFEIIFKIPIPEHEIKEKLGLS